MQFIVVRTARALLAAEDEYESLGSCDVTNLSFKHSARSNFKKLSVSDSL